MFFQQPKRFKGRRRPHLIRLTGITFEQLQKSLTKSGASGDEVTVRIVESDFSEDLTDRSAAEESDLIKEDAGKEGLELDEEVSEKSKSEIRENTEGDREELVEFDMTENITPLEMAEERQLQDSETEVNPETTVSDQEENLNAEAAQQQLEKKFEIEQADTRKEIEQIGNQSELGDISELSAIEQIGEQSGIEEIRTQSQFDNIEVQQTIDPLEDIPVEQFNTQTVKEQLKLLSELDQINSQSGNEQILKQSVIGVFGEQVDAIQEDIQLQLDQDRSNIALAKELAGAPEVEEQSLSQLNLKEHLPQQKQEEIDDLTPIMKEILQNIGQVIREMNGSPADVVEGIEIFEREISNPSQSTVNARTISDALEVTSTNGKSKMSEIIKGTELLDMTPLLLDIEKGITKAEDTKDTLKESLILISEQEIPRSVKAQNIQTDIDAHTEQDIAVVDSTQTNFPSGKALDQVKVENLAVSGKSLAGDVENQLESKDILESQLNEDFSTNGKTIANAINKIRPHESESEVEQSTSENLKEIMDIEEDSTVDNVETPEREPRLPLVFRISTSNGRTFLERMNSASFFEKQEEREKEKTEEESTIKFEEFEKETISNHEDEKDIKELSEGDANRLSQSASGVIIQEAKEVALETLFREDTETKESDAVNRFLLQNSKTTATENNIEPTGLDTKMTIGKTLSETSGQTESDSEASVIKLVDEKSEANVSNIPIMLGIIFTRGANTETTRNEVTAIQQTNSKINLGKSLAETEAPLDNDQSPGDGTTVSPEEPVSRRSGSRQENRGKGINDAERNLKSAVQLREDTVEIKSGDDVLTESEGRTQSTQSIQDILNDAIIPIRTVEITQEVNPNLEARVFVAGAPRGLSGNQMFDLENFILTSHLGSLPNLPEDSSSSQSEELTLLQNAETQTIFDIALPNSPSSELEINLPELLSRLAKQRDGDNLVSNKGKAITSEKRGVGRTQQQQSSESLESSNSLEGFVTFNSLEDVQKMIGKPIVEVLRSGTASRENSKELNEASQLSIVSSNQIKFW